METDMLAEEIQKLRREKQDLEMKVDALTRRLISFETVMDIIPDGYIVVGRDGNILYVNSAYCSHFGVTREEALGKPVTWLIPNTKLVEIMEKDLTQVDVLHEYPDGLTVTGERKVVTTRLPIKLPSGEIIASGALTKFSRYTVKLLQSLHALEGEVEYYRKELSRHAEMEFTFEKLPTCSQPFRKAKELAERFAANDLPILLRGETGVGKEVFAKAIHNASARRNGPFICINCTSIPADLLESELFGYEEGAFTGGRRGGKKGKFELANQGTLFLDEIGDMPVSMQVKLLRVLQDNVVEKLGSEEKNVCVDVRIITATNQDLEQKIEDKSFRDDLYYRLNVLPVFIPALRERIEDIPALAYTFLEELNNKYEPHREIAPETMACLQRYSWPGNIRELKNMIGRLFMTADKKTIRPECLPPYLLSGMDGHASDSEGFRMLSPRQERDMLMDTLLRYNLNCSKAAAALGIHRTTLYGKLEKYGIRISDLRTAQTPPDVKPGAHGG